jgi:aryl-alcohol dehydrogenase-like predicted oxidoreductase
LQTLDTLVKSGKVRYIGCSNFAAWQLSEALWTSKVHGLESFISIQSEYSLLDRGIEQEIVPCCQTHGVGVIPYRALAAGFLTGKYHKEESLGTHSEIVSNSSASRFLNDANFSLLDKLQLFATEKGHTVGELAIAWLLSHPWLATVIVGATDSRQLAPHVAATEWELNAEEIAKVNSILYF